MLRLPKFPSLFLYGDKIVSENGYESPEAIEAVREAAQGSFGDQPTVEWIGMKLNPENEERTFGYLLRLDECEFDEFHSFFEELKSIKKMGGEFMQGLTPSGFS